jgi:hypothetical protein
MGEYMKFQKLPPAQQKGKLGQEVKKAVSRLAQKLGRVQVFTLKDGRCQMSDQYYLPPGDHVISLGGGRSQSVSIDAGVTIPIRQCSP